MQAYIFITSENKMMMATRKPKVQQLGADHFILGGILENPEASRDGPIWNEIVHQVSELMAVQRN